jgi:hypothetical protein
LLNEKEKNKEDEDLNANFITTVSTSSCDLWESTSTSSSSSTSPTNNNKIKNSSTFRTIFDRFQDKINNEQSSKLNKNRHSLDQKSSTLKLVEETFPELRRKSSISYDFKSRKEISYRNISPIDTVSCQHSFKKGDNRSLTEISSLFKLKNF